jgi:hypothetical protein
MIGFKGGKYVDESEKLAKRVRKAAWDALRRLGFLIRQKAQSEIEISDTPSLPGDPPHTRQKRLPKGILYGTPDDGPPSVIAGPAKNLVGTLGRALEEGGESLVSASTPDKPPVELEPRPFMGPALAAEVGELPGLLADKMKQL